MRLRPLTTWLVALAATLGCMPQSSHPAGPLPAGGTHVLFIGNSLTYYHDLPRIVEQLGALTGDTIRTATLAKPDYALVDHIADGGARSAIARERWNVVVLQQGSSALEEGRSLLYAGVDGLAPLIRAAGGRPALYEVWPTAARRFDVAGVRASYLTAAQRVNGDFYPAGTAWVEAWARDASLVLYEADGLHPTATGSFLAALVMFERLTGRDARTLPAVAYADGARLGLAEPAVRLLQEAAHAANARGNSP
ncbi:MAG: SGNH/GDSL hydrolase family protein [Gemmatimonadaceae bacterium]